MNKHLLGHAFVQSISAEALTSNAVNHPYLQALCAGDLPNIDLALKDFAFQYGLYSSQFIRYISIVIKNLSSIEHKKILQSNLAEEQGDIQGITLPPDVLESIAGQPHTKLFRRFQTALGVSTEDCSEQDSEIGLNWSHQFVALCNVNEYVGVGAVGIGTELIVSSIYKQILQSLKAHTNLTMTQRVFFDLHSQCDETHATEILMIAEALAQDQAACEQIEYGAQKAIAMRVTFWDEMLARARNMPPSSTTATEELSAIGY